MILTDYVFEGHWNVLDEKNFSSIPTGKRVLLSDGDTVVIGTLTIQEDTVHCIFDRDNLTGYKPIAWMDLPLTSPLGKS